MSTTRDYVLLSADGDKTIATFDNWPDARRVWEAERDVRAVRLVVMWPCGCVRQAVRLRHNGNHSGWRRVQACPEHARRRV